jgi:outer membrane protein assembly factor BamB
MKNTFNRTTIIIAVILTLITIVSPVSASDWPQFQKDEINTGTTNDSGPISDPVAVWYQQTTGTGMGGIDTAPVIADGQVFVIDYQAVVWAYNKTTGKENWNTSCSQPGTFELSTPAYSNGILYAATSAADFDQGYCKVTALYTNNGTIRESITLRTQNGYQLNSPITYSDDKIYIGDWNGSSSSTNGTGIYYCLNADNVSEIIWEYQPNRITGYYWAGAAIAGDYIIFGDDTANVTCLDKNTGVLVDYFNVSQQCGCSDPVEKIRSSILWVESTGHIYFTAMYDDNANVGYGTGHIYAVPFNSTTGDLGGNDALGGGDCEWNNSIKNSKSTPVYYDGRLYVGSGYRMYQTNHTGKMCCLDASDGNLIWEWSDPYGRVKASPALSIVDGRKFIYFTTNVHNASAYCLEDMGDNYEIRWIWNPPEPDNQYILHGMAISDGIIYFGTDYGRLFALQDQINPVLNGSDWPQFHSDIANTGHSPCDAPDDNTTKWISDNIGAVASSQAVIAGERVFVYADDNITALDRSDGSVLWNTSILPASELWGHQSAAWNDDMVFIGSGSNVWCLDDSNGSIIWNITLPGTDPFIVNSAPTVSDGLVFIGDYNNDVYYALDEATGAIDHSYTVGGNAISTVAVDNTEDLVFFGDGGNNTVYCADKNSDTIIWQRTLDGFVGSSVVINAQNDLVYIATYPTGLPGSIYAFNESTGTLIWNSSMTAGTNSVPAIAYGNVYISIDNAVYCFDALTGTEVWSVTGWGSWTDSPAAADGKIFVGNVGSWAQNPNGLAALDPATGVVIWQYGSTAGSPVSVSCYDSDPVAVTIGSDGVVYAFGTPTANGSVSSETISIGSATVDVNDTVVIPVMIENVTDIQQVSLDVVYDPDVVSIVNITTNEYIPSSTISYTLNAGSTTIVLINDNITVTGSTPLIDITFLAADNNATTVLDLQNVELTDDYGSHVPDTIVNGNIMVCIKGDFNYNDRVDIGDAAKVAFMVAGKEPEDPRADFNNNGRVDIGDAAKISFYLAAKQSKL